MRDCVKTYYFKLGMMALEDWYSQGLVTFQEYNEVKSKLKEKYLQETVN